MNIQVSFFRYRFRVGPYPKMGVRFRMKSHPKMTPGCSFPYVTGGNKRGETSRKQQYLLARSEYHTQLAKMSFDEIFDLTAGVYFHFI